MPLSFPFSFTENLTAMTVSTIFLYRPGFLFFLNRFLFSLLALSCLTHAKQLNVNVSATSGILMNAETGAILYEKNAYARCSPASITKIATALYAIEKKGDMLDELVTVEPECLVWISQDKKETDRKRYPSYLLQPDGTAMGLKAHEKISWRSLLYGLILRSGNDAANVIAHHVSGTIPNFLTELNRYIEEKGAKSTCFLNPHGLPDPNHMTCAYDMAVIMREGLKYPFFRDVIGTVRYTHPPTNVQPERVLVHTNQLLKRGPCYYPKAIGGKTGYHSKAGHTIVSVAAHEGRTLIAVLLNSSSIQQKYKDAIALFEAAFAEKKMERMIFNKDYDFFRLEIKGAKSPLEAALHENCILSYFPSEEPEFKTFLHWDHPLLPIKSGATVGAIHLKNPQGHLLLEVPLYAVHDVNPTLIFQASRLMNINHLKTAMILVLLVSGGTFWHHRRKRENRAS